MMAQATNRESIALTGCSIVPDRRPRACFCGDDGRMTSTLAVSEKSSGERERGVALVFASALTWSFGGAIARFIAVPDSWTVVFWRSIWASLFLIAFMLVRDGPRGTVALFRSMGLPGVAVGALQAAASTAFIMALSYTTVANILLMQAGVPTALSFRPG